MDSEQPHRADRRWASLDVGCAEHPRRGIFRRAGATCLGGDPLHQGSSSEVEARCGLLRGCNPRTPLERTQTWPTAPMTRPRTRTSRTPCTAWDTAEQDGQTPIQSSPLKTTQVNSIERMPSMTQPLRRSERILLNFSRVSPKAMENTCAGGSSTLCRIHGIPSSSFLFIGVLVVLHTENQQIGLFFVLAFAGISCRFHSYGKASFGSSLRRFLSWLSCLP